jgi:hypothetical protein
MTMKDGDIVEAWITRYALTGPIIHERVRISFSRHDEKAIYVTNVSQDNRYFILLGTDAFLSEAEARKSVEAKRTRKILSLEKQIAKLRALEVKVAPDETL